jgi:hypothetical protein
LEEGGFDTLLDFVWERVRRDRDDRNVRGDQIGTQYFKGFKSTDSAQMDIHQDHFRIVRASHCNALTAINRRRKV